MQSKLADMVTGEQVGIWLIICFLVLYFVYKEYPEFKRRITSGVQKERTLEDADRDMADRLSNVEKRLEKIDAKLERDYGRINSIQQDTIHNKRLVEESLEEREIIMRALLGALGGLQELGANGPTKVAKTEIQDYLNRKAHCNDAEAFQNSSE